MDKLSNSLLSINSQRSLFVRSPSTRDNKHRIAIESAFLYCPGIQNVEGQLELQERVIKEKSPKKRLVPEDSKWLHS